MRRETVEFKFELNKAKVSQHSEDLHAIGAGHLLSMIGGSDTLKVTYTLNLNYLGRTEEALDAIGRMTDDKSLVVACSKKELRHGYCLFESIMNKVRALQEKFR